LHNIGRKNTKIATLHANVSHNTQGASMKSQNFPFAPHAIEGYRLRERRLRMLRRLGFTVSSALSLLCFLLGYAVARWF